MSGLYDGATGLNKGIGLQFQKIIGSAGLNAYVVPSGGGNLPGLGYWDDTSTWDDTVAWADNP